MIIFFYGADTYRSRQALSEIKNKFIRELDPEESSLNVLDGASANLKEISAKINTGSLFTKKRLTVIENIFKNKSEKIYSELEGYLKNLKNDELNIIVFRDEELNSREKPLKKEAKKLFTFLTSQKYSQEFKPLSGNALLLFIQKELKNYQKEISLSAANLLIDYFSGDLWTISGELKKLAFGTDEKIISREMVKNAAQETFNEDIFALTDALSSKDKRALSSLFEKQRAAGLSDEYLLAMLIRQFKILLQIKNASLKTNDSTLIAAKLKLHPYVVKKGLAQSRGLKEEQLKTYLNRLVQLDFSNKSGQGDLKKELFLFIMEL
jgi:DNA polymerase-3 subunit delta